MDEIISKWPLVGQVLLYVVSFNLLLGGIKKALDEIKDKTPSPVDNKISAFLEKPISWISKVLDIIGFNPQHK